MRRTLPQRRAAKPLTCGSGTSRSRVTVGFYPDGTPGEVFIDSGKSGQDIRAWPAMPPWC